MEHSDYCLIRFVFLFEYPFDASSKPTAAVITFDVSDADAVRACFRRLRELREAIADTAHAVDARELSMGMSGDYELAIAEGATVVRIGQAIFGARPTPDSHCWPDAGHRSLSSANGS